MHPEVWAEREQSNMLVFHTLGAAECRRQSTLGRTGPPVEANTSPYAG
jgi:hypothetical protein